MKFVVNFIFYFAASFTVIGMGDESFDEGFTLNFDTEDDTELLNDNNTPNLPNVLVKIIFEKVLISEITGLKKLTKKIYQELENNNDPEVINKYISDGAKLHKYPLKLRLLNRKWNEFVIETIYRLYKEYEITDQLQPLNDVLKRRIKHGVMKSLSSADRINYGAVLAKPN